jgi:hypothetical protein
MWLYLKIDSPVTTAKFINKWSLFILLAVGIRRLELKPNSEQKVENISVALPYCQTAYCKHALLSTEMKRAALVLTALV